MQGKMKIIDKRSFWRLFWLVCGMLLVWGSCRFYPFNGLAFALDKIRPGMTVDEVSACIPKRFYAKTEKAASHCLADRVFNLERCVCTILYFEEEYFGGGRGWGEVYFDANGIVAGLSYASPELFGLGKSPYNAQTLTGQIRYRLDLCAPD